MKKEELEQKIKSLPDVKGKTTGWKDLDINNIFLHKFDEKNRRLYKKMEDDFYKRKKKFHLKGFYTDNAILTEINISDIYPTQIGLDRDGLLAFLDETNKHKSSTEYPVAIKTNDGKILLIEGHHRIAMDILKGKEKINLKLRPPRDDYFYNFSGGGIIEKKYYDAGGFIKCPHCGSSEK